MLDVGVMAGGNTLANPLTATTVRLIEGKNDLYQESLLDTASPSVARIAKTGALMFKKIVVGLDGSPESEHALRMACDIAQKYDSEVHLVHTPEPKTVAFALGAVAGYHTATTMPSAKDIVAACDKIVDAAKVVASEYNVDVSNVHTDQGHPADEIIACADKTGADLIVTGRRGLGSVGSLLQGSTSQRINHQAKCACLSVV